MYSLGDQTFSLFLMCGMKLVWNAWLRKTMRSGCNCSSEGLSGSDWLKAEGSVNNWEQQNAITGSSFLPLRLQSFFECQPSIQWLRVKAATALLLLLCPDSFEFWLDFSEYREEHAPELTNNSLCLTAAPFVLRCTELKGVTSPTVSSPAGLLSKARADGNVWWL